MRNEPSYLTKFQVGKVTSSAESEADWETAVQLVTSTIFEQKVEILLPAGYSVFVESTTIESSGTFFEPDFDYLEETGQTLYNQSADASLTSSRSSVRMYAVLTRLVPEFLAKDFPCRQSADIDFANDYYDEQFEALSFFEDWAESILSCSVEGAAISVATPERLLKEFEVLTKREIANRTSNIFRRIENNVSIALYQAFGKTHTFFPLTPTSFTN